VMVAWPNIAGNGHVKRQTRIAAIPILQPGRPSLTAHRTPPSQGVGQPSQPIFIFLSFSFHFSFLLILNFFQFKKCLDLKKFKFKLFSNFKFIHF
jgi:hypothetical protein